jgi:hypothetical protein
VTDATPPPDLFPSLDEAFARRVQDRLRTRFAHEAPEIAWEDWVKLKPYLAAYKREAEYIRGFLNKGRASVLRDISKRSRALLDAIGRAREAHLEKPISRALGQMALSEFEDLLGTLEEDFRLDGKIAPDLEDMTRADLFANFELWWKRSADMPATIDEGSAGDTWPTAFMFVANEVFTLRGMPVPAMGTSYQSLKNYRHADRTRFEGAKKLAEKLKAKGLLE